ncbi:MAG TPA: glycosyltransferase family 4 protein [Chloroflexi bacterium]|jgi:glycosyltransferase involved in cell wall biosynthesis|nr:glycosyltransferase family 4 protein [Chloroflexota bacterium]
MGRRPAVCVLTSQYFAWGKYGGFGSMSRKLCEGLARRGYDVSVIVPRRAGQAPVEVLNGVAVHSFRALHLREAVQVIRSCRADIFHSQDPTLLTRLAQELAPNRAHIVTCRDPRDAHDWLIEFWYATARRRLLTPFNYMTESSFLVNEAVRRADAVFVPARFLQEKVRRMYRLRQPVGFLPNLIDVPECIPPKAECPTMVYVARWDKRKRPWLFLELAHRFPQYRFIAVGRAEDATYDATLRQQYGDAVNLEAPGFVDRFTEAGRLERILSESWILVNTAAREGLPLTFLEASAYGCAILSAVDPDGFATQFGYHVTDDDFVRALEQLMAQAPLEKGRLAHAYVRRTYENAMALDAHCRVYAQYAG